MINLKTTLEATKKGVTNKPGTKRTDGAGDTPRKTITVIK